MRAGNFAGVANIYDPLTGLQFPGNVIPANRIDPAAAAILRLLPDPQSSATVNNYTSTPSKTQHDDSFDLKIDHRFNQRDSLFARYSFNNTTTVLPEPFPSVNGMNVGGGPSFPGTADQRAQQIGISWNRVWTSAVLLEVKGGWSRYDADTVPTNYGINVSQQVGIPGINVDADSSGLTRLAIAGYPTLGDATFIPLLNKNTVYQWLANVHYLKGAHTLKFGTDVKLRDFFAFQSNQARGQFTFNGNFTSNAGAAGTGHSIASFLLGYPSATVRSKYLAEPTYAANEVAGYVQDDWRVRSWLTLNLGLRYDYYAPLTEADNQIANVDLAAGVIKTAGQTGLSDSAGVKPDRGNFAPRLGAAATLNDSTVLRGGYALSFSPPFVGTPLAFRNPPFVNLVNISPSTFVPINRLSEGLPPITPTDPAQRNGLMIHSVPNRGGNSIGTTTMLQGVTYVQSGWQGDLLAQCSPSTAIPYPCFDLNSGPYGTLNTTTGVLTAPSVADAAGAGGLKTLAGFVATPRRRRSPAPRSRVGRRTGGRTQGRFRRQAARCGAAPRRSDRRRVRPPHPGP